MTMGGVVGGLIALVIVKHLELKTLRWLVMIVVAYAAVSMLRSAMKERSQKASSPVERPA